MRNAIALLIVCLLTPAAIAATTNNDDSCDIGLYPAATLLLPYFEVDTATRGVDTFFTVTNVSNLPQIAHVTIWTDWAYPVLTFNVFLTGYDTQSISLYDVIVNGVIAPTNPNLTVAGTSSNTTPGTLSAANGANPNMSISDCASLPGFVAQPIRTAMQSALVTGIYNASGSGTFSCGSTAVGSPAATHRNLTSAVGFVTIDVTSRCTPTFTSDPAYFASEILFDNVLTGDYSMLDKTAGSNYAGGNPLVHIRAIPEGGAAGSLPASGAPVTPLPYTFYGRYINGQTVNGVAVTPHLDRRQPLASTFAARFIQGGPNAFATDLKVWREGVSGPTTCANAVVNRDLLVPEIVRFDEHENPNIFTNNVIICTVTPFFIVLPATSRTSSASATYPAMNTPSGDIAGWLYLNLDSGKANTVVNTISHPDFTSRRPSQNWVSVTMTAGGPTSGLFGIESDATALGNGCTPATAVTSADGGAKPIGPAPNANP
jgi:hypothetical protein